MGTPPVIPKSPSTPTERFFSTFDLAAVLCAVGVKSAVLASLTPVAVGLVQELRRAHTGGINLSGLPVASTAIGACISTTVFYFCIPARVHEGRVPYILYGVLLLAGQIVYVAVFLELPHAALMGQISSSGSSESTAGLGHSRTVSERRLAFGLAIATAGRLVMALGDGCVYTGKRMIARRLGPGSRRDAFFLITSFADIGLFGGPLLVGLFMTLFNLGEASAPLAVGIALALAAIALFVYCPMDTKWPSEESASSDDDDAPLEEATSDCAPLETHGLLPTEEKPPIFVAVTVQAVGFFFGISRRVCWFAYESSTVVVFAEHFSYSDAGAGIIVGVLGLTAVVPISIVYYLMVWRFKWDLETHSYAVVLVAASFGVVASVLILLAAQDAESGLWCMMLSALPMYAFVTYSTAVGNSHAVKFALDDSPFFNRDAIMAQQEMLQAPIGAAVGLIVGRDVLGDVINVEALGRLFLGLTLLQVAVLAVGWDPRIWMRLIKRA